MTAQILKSQIKDEGEFRAAIEAHIAAKLRAMDESGPVPADAFLEQFIRRTPRGDPYPDLMEVDYDIIDDTPSPAPEVAP